MIYEKQGMTPSEVRQFYRNQLINFYKVGFGKKTSNGVIVTQTLVNVTKKRLKQLGGER